jgi:hypothetical protein
VVSRRKTESDDEPRRRRPPTTPEEQENRLVSLAFEAIERRIQDGSASAQELVHFAKLGSTREKLERQKIEYEIKLAEVKAESYATQGRIEELYVKAVDAMQSYSTGRQTDPAEEYDG